MFTIWVVVVSWVYTYVKTNHAFLNVQFIVGQSYINKTVFKLLKMKKTHISLTLLVSACKTEYH